MSAFVSRAKPYGFPLAWFMQIWSEVMKVVPSDTVPYSSPAFPCVMELTEVLLKIINRFEMFCETLDMFASRAAFRLEA